MSGNSANTCPEEASCNILDSKLLDACIHCGMCLPACPTYLATGREMESPRGRIYLLTLWNQGAQELSRRTAEHIDSCLGCLGCQTACPSGVNYEEILSEARPHLAKLRDPLQRRLLRTIFRRLLPDYRLMRFIGDQIRRWQKSGGGRLLRWLAYPASVERESDPDCINPLRKLLRKVQTWEELAPVVPKFQALALQSGAKDGPPVQLFTGCMMDIFYNHVNHACRRLLACQNFCVQVPQQTCCGALAMHAGETDIACELAKRNITLFSQSKGAIAVSAAGCGAMLKQYGHLLKDDSQWAERARQFSCRVQDITETLAAGQFPAAKNRLVTNTKPVSVAYHAACHLAHAQQIRAQPERLLSAAAAACGQASDKVALHLVPLPEAEHCCGSAGIYNLLHTALSFDVLERKMRCIAESKAQVVVSTNPGCLLQLKAGARRAKLNLDVKHLCELLDEIYCGGDAGL